MSGLKPQTAFLLRGSFLVLGLLILWWLVLQEPMLFLLRESAGAVGGFVLGVPPSRFVAETPGGDWTFKVPIEFRSATSPNGPPVLFHSIDFDMARADVSTFTFSLPVFWAIALALPWSARSWRVLIQGTLSMGLVEILLLLVLVEIFAHKTAAQMAQSQSAVGSWLVRSSEYVVIGVLPYITPFFIAFWLHSEWTRQVFHPAAAAVPAETTRNHKRRPGNTEENGS